MPDFNTVKVVKDPQNPRIGRLQLNRPDKLNAISSSMPSDIQAAVRYLEADDEVHVIIVEGEGRAFCAGYDLNEYAEGTDPANITDDHPCRQEKTPWDPMVDYQLMKRHTEEFMSLWRCTKPQASHWFTSLPMACLLTPARAARSVRREPSSARCRVM